MSKQFRIPSPKGLTSQERRARRFLLKFHAPLEPGDPRNSKNFRSPLDPSKPQGRMFVGHGSAQQYMLDTEAKRVKARATRKARRAARARAR